MFRNFFGNETDIVQSNPMEQQLAQQKDLTPAIEEPESPLDMDDPLDRMEYHWRKFKNQLIEIYDNHTGEKYIDANQGELIDLYIRKDLDEVKAILLEEDFEMQEDKFADIGDCIEAAIRKNYFVDLVT